MTFYSSLTGKKTKKNRDRMQPYFQTSGCMLHQLYNHIEGPTLTGHFLCAS